jgi:hypothetical protein
MTRAILSALALGLLATPSSPSVDCGSTYVGFLERLNHRAEVMSGEQLAALHRAGLRIFDACATGHLDNVQARFSALENRLGRPPGDGH